MLKALGVERLFWLICLFIEWKSWTVQREWQTGVVVALFKKGDKRVCAYYGKEGPAVSRTSDSGMRFVTYPLCDILGQDLEAKSWRRGYTVW